MFEMICRVFKIAGNSRRKIVAGIVCNILKSFFNGFMMFGVFWILLHLDGLSPAIIGQAFGVILGSVLGRFFFQWMYDRTMSGSGYDIFRDYRLEIGERLKQAPMGYFSEQNLGTIQAMLTTTIADLEGYSMLAIEQMTSGVAMAVLMSVMMFFFSPVIAGLSLVGLALGMLVLRWVRLRAAQYAPIYRTYSLTFIFYLVLAPAISGVLNKIMYISESFTQIDGNVERMEEVLSIPVLQNQDVGAREQGHSIEFDHVSFSYDTGTSVKALNDVSFIARQGEVTAIVGPSGGGKSTIANLISRFWDVTEGCIRIGGVDIRKIPQAELMRQVSFVFQDTFLFKQSILDNIRMGNPTASEAQVIEAAKAAQCHDFIEKLPDGYHTMIGASGIRLSGGERQRIAIARAIIKDAPIIVLDEATAFSDPENEYLIQKAFEKLIQNKTVIMIAHRLSTIRNADQILVMEHGQLIEQGTHDTLMERQGKYTQMWNSYMESISWKIRAGKGGAIE